MPDMKATMDEWKKGELHSGSKKGPVVKSQKQALAIAFHEGGEARPPKKKKGKAAAVKQRKVGAAMSSGLIRQAYQSHAEG